MTLTFLLFYFGLWGAGDSKILILVALCLPGRIFCNQGIWSFPGFVLLAIIFACSFILIIVESVAKSIREKKSLHIETNALHVSKPQLKRALLSILVVGIFNQICSYFPGMGESLLYAIDFIIILLINSNSANLPLRCLALLSGIYIATCIIARSVFSWKTLFLSLIIIVAIHILQALFSEDNYNVISAQNVKEGMILAPPSVVVLQNSAIEGLPRMTSSDMRSRLSANEVDAIHEWGRQLGDDAMLVIVQKVPFVIYIAIGTLIFWGLGVARV